MARAVSSNGRRYEQIIEGEWGPWDRRANWHRCCDCGLVHRVDYRIVGRRNRIEARYKTDQKSTDRIRKRAGIILKRRPQK
jgi:hypothetical protein